jgi:c-di-GMP-related signal transduction protein
MNRCNDWRRLLEIANKELSRKGYELKVYEDEEGCYSCDVWKSGKALEIYAENYFEDELSALVNDAWAYVNGLD